MKKLLSVLMVMIFLGCKDDPIPKPNAYLRLDYPEPTYKRLDIGLPFTFEKNTFSDSISTIKVSNGGRDKGIDLVYPKMKGTIYLTYKQVGPDNLKDFLIDAQNLTQKHTIKADEIVEQPYANNEHRVYGMFYEVGGNAASQSQFYVTDSTNHFITGSLYFYAKPNYDSILPAAYYLRNDIKHLMETIRWKE